MTRRLSQCLLLAAALLLGLPVAGLALEILYPANETAVRRSDYLVLDIAEPLPLEGITVTINDVPSDIFDISGDQYRQQFGDILILLPEFDPGENRIVVEGYRGDEVIRQARATIYLLGLREEPPEAYQLFVMHTAEREAHCAGCHYKFDFTAAQLEKSDIVKNACMACHERNLLALEHVHGPVGAMECFTCHDADSTPSRYAVRSGDAELCVDCHSDQAEEMATKKNVHGPLAAGSCLVCHDPHASAEHGQLVRSANDLCLECHVIKVENHVLRTVSGKAHPLSDKPDPSREGRMLDCTSCHTPHAANGRAYLQGDVTSAMMLCTRCHKK